MRSVLALLILLAAPPAADAATVSVEPFRWDSSFGSCPRTMSCPADMVVFTAASGEINHVAITETVVGFDRSSYLLRDRSATPLVAGAGCERVDESPFSAAVVCTAEALGPQQLGDGDDTLASPSGLASGGDGDDVMSVSFGRVDGGAGDDVLLVAIGRANGEDGDDVLIGQFGAGGSGDDLVMGSGRGGFGDDTMSCYPRDVSCFLAGGAGDDVLTGGTHGDRLFGGGGRDLVDGGVRDDILEGGPGNDRLTGGPGRDALRGGAGADRLEAHEDPAAGEKQKKDDVDCGNGRRDHAAVDRRDQVKRCERVT